MKAEIIVMKGSKQLYATDESAAIFIQGSEDFHYENLFIYKDNYTRLRVRQLLRAANDEGLTTLVLDDKWNLNLVLEAIAQESHGFKYVVFAIEDDTLYRMYLERLKLLQVVAKARIEENL